MANDTSLSHFIDFLPLAGLPDLAVASRKFGEIMQQEASETKDGDPEDPGELLETRLIHDGILISSPAWRGVRWLDEGENQEAIDSISDTLIQEFPTLAFVLANREITQPGNRFVARAHFRWPGAMGLEESVGLDISGTSAPMVRKNHEGVMEMAPEEQADIEKIIGGCLSQIPQAKEYFRANQVSSDMDKNLPQAKHEDGPPARTLRF